MVPNDDLEAILARVVQDFLDAQLQGRDPDIEEMVRAHPELDQQIRQRIKSLREVDDLFAGLVQEIDDPALTPSDHDLIGKRLGDFEILSLIGRGGMGAVFLARQVPLGREVALKVIADVAGEQSRTLERFKREARVLAQLSHPHIVPIHDTGQEGPYTYFAMEYIRGVSLDAVLAAVRHADASKKASEVLREQLQRTKANGTQPPEPTIHEASGSQIDRDYILAISNIIMDVGSALQCAHEQGILHRDVKPSNILIDAAGTAKLVDFGLARVQSHPSLTVTGEFFGTPNYVSPEQIHNPDSVDRRADVYSLAATYYECLTLRRPFEGDTVNETLTNVLNREVIPPRRHSPRLAPDLNTVVLHALEKQPQDRYQNAADFAADIKNVLDFKPTTARPPAATTRIGRTLRRNKLKTAFSLLIIAAILLGISLYRESMKEAARKRASKIQRLLNDADLLLCQAAFDPHGWPVLAAEPLVERAVKSYSEVLKIDSRNWWALIQRGVARLIVGANREEALRDFEQAERLKPDFTPLDTLKTLAVDNSDEKAQGVQQLTVQNLDAREAFTCGMLACKDGLGAQSESWVDLFTLCVEKEPAFLPGQVARACVRCQTGHNLEECLTLLRANPGCTILHLLVARELDTWSSGRPEEAAAQYETAVRLQPWNPVCHVRLADAYGRAGKVEGVEAHLKAACELDSTSSSYLQLARFYSRQQDHRGALAVCDNGLKKKHDLHCESELLEIKAGCLQRLGRTEELPSCIKRWEQCLRSLVTGMPSPSWGSYYHERLLEFLWNNGRRQETRLFVADSAQTAPLYQLGLGNYLCQLYESEGDFTNALLVCNQLYEQLLGSNAFDTPTGFHEALDIVTRRARYQLLPGADTSDATRTWDTILGRFPQNGSLWWYYGMFLDDSIRDHVKAAEAYRQALRYETTEGQRVVTGFYLARALQRAGNLPEAREELRALVHKIENMRIMSHRDIDDHAGQTDIVEASIARDIYATLSDMYWSEHHADPAIAVLERGVQRVPSQPQLIRELARKLTLIGSTSEAIAKYTTYFTSLPRDLSSSKDNLIDFPLEAYSAGQAMLALTGLLLQTGDLDGAERFLRREEQLGRSVPPNDLGELPSYAAYRNACWARVHRAKGDTKPASAESDAPGQTQPGDK